MEPQVKSYIEQRNLVKTDEPKCAWRKPILMFVPLQVTAQPSSELDALDVNKG